jgi:hypothetical protein
MAGRIIFMARLWSRKKKYPVGKLVYGKMYIHKNYIFTLPEADRALITEAERALYRYDVEFDDWNVVSYDVKRASEARDISFNLYLRFDEDPHPMLMSSMRVLPSKVSRSNTSPLYILHRKELMVGPDHHNRYLWEQLTKDEESAGLFDTSHKTRIGRKTYWEALLYEKKLEINDHVLCLWGGVPFRTTLR